MIRYKVFEATKRSMCAHLQGAAVTQLQEEPGLAVGDIGGTERGAGAVPDGHAGADVAAERAPRVRDRAHHIDMAEPCCYVRLHWQAILDTRLVIVHDDLWSTVVGNLGRMQNSCD